MITCFHGVLIFGLGCRDDRVTLVPQSTQATPSSEASSDETEAKGKEPIAKDLASLCEESRVALQSGDTKKAYDLARSATRLAPNDPQVAHTMALVFGQQQRFPEAIRMFDKLAESEPSSRISLWGQSALWMVMNGQWENAEARLRTILDASPETVIASRQLAQLLVREGRRSEAAVLLHPICRRGETIEPELRMLLQISLPFAGDARRESFEPIGLLGKAVTERAEKKTVQEISKLILKSSTDSRYASLLGRIYAEQSDFDSLAKWSTEHPIGNDMQADTWFAWGAYQLSRAKNRDAVRCFCEVILLDPTDSSAYRKLSESLFHLGASNEARSVAARAAMLRRTQALGAKMSASNTRDQKDLSEVARLLDELNRPFESLAWRTVQLGYAKSQLSESQLRQVLEGIEQSRRELLSDSTAEASQDFILCGVDIDAYRN